MPTWRGIITTPTTDGPSVMPCHICFYATFIKKNKSMSIKFILYTLPLRPCLGNIFAFLFACLQSFFYRQTPVLLHAYVLHLTNSFSQSVREFPLKLYLHFL